jgi:type II secretory pathway predicted ATPase ExeA
MYESFYNLAEKPFNLTTSTRFLYLGEKHKEALAMLKYGVMERKGFILLTGEVGTGKTTMVRALLDNLNSNVRYVYLANPVLSPEDFMSYVAFSAFKKWVHFKSKAQFLATFEAFLGQCLEKKINFNLIIDEAHRLSFDLLEEIRLLSNMETGDEKLINIFLVGQPELNEKLRDPKSRALLQRIAIRYHISPLNQQETKAYMNTRWKAAGGENFDQVFPRNAVGAVYRHSGGYPRVINILADNVLLLGYSRGKNKITEAMITECHKDMQLESPFPEPEKVEESQEFDESTDTEEAPKRRRWGWTALVVFLALLILVGAGMSDKGRGIISQWMDHAPPKVRSLFGHSRQEPLVVPEKKQEYEVPKINTDKTQSQSGETSPGPEQREEAGVVTLARAVETEDAESPPVPQKAEPPKSMVVKSGDTILGLALQVYGTANERILDLIRESNPGIKNIHRIDVGQQILFPPLKEAEKKGTFTVHVASFKSFERARDYFQELVGGGYEAYIIPANDPVTGPIFRIALGSFESREDGDAYAALILSRKVSDYAETIELEMK